MNQQNLSLFMEDIFQPTLLHADLLFDIFIIEK
jgi:hypothetical protein